VTEVGQVITTITLLIELASSCLKQTSPAMFGHYAKPCPLATKDRECATGQSGETIT